MMFDHGDRDWEVLEPADPPVREVDEQEDLEAEAGTAVVERLGHVNFRFHLFYICTVFHFFLHFIE